MTETIPVTREQFCELVHLLDHYPGLDNQSLQLDRLAVVPCTELDRGSCVYVSLDQGIVDYDAAMAAPLTEPVIGISRDGFTEEV